MEDPNKKNDASTAKTEEEETSSAVKTEEEEASAVKTEEKEKVIRQESMEAVKVAAIKTEDAFDKIMNSELFKDDTTLDNE
jgi:hypothetical protein